MSKIELRKYIEENFLDKNKKLKATVIRYNHINKIKNDLLKFIDNDVSLVERLYLFYFNKTKPKCTCGKYTTFMGFTKGYSKYCSVKCGTSDKETLNKKKQTSLKRFGTTIPQQLDTVKKKSKKTCLEKYNTEYFFQTEQKKNKSKKTCLKKYGVENISQSEEIKKKKEKTNLKKYGVKNPYQIKEIKEKALRNKTIKKAKQIITNLKDVIPLFDVKQDYKNILKEYNWKCLKCKKSFNDYLLNDHPYCPYCYKKYSGNSKLEKELISFINSLNIHQINNSKQIIPPLELDIYIPSHNLAIEFNGLYWHSDKIVDKKYHLLKTQQCQEKNIQLIHIFEDEWLYKKNIVKSRLKYILGLNENRIGARQCIIKEIDSKIKNQFLNKYHIQGEDKSNIKLGAYHEYKLVGVMTFSKPRIFMNKKDKEGAWELSRFATIDNTHTPGLASKMVKYFERNYEWREIYSYADRKWSQGNLYYRLGFEYEGETAPNYWYWNRYNKIKQHRYKYRKSELRSFPNYSENKTEKEIMDEAGYLRIYDCGNLRFSKKK